MRDYVILYIVPHMGWRKGQYEQIFCDNQPKFQSSSMSTCKMNEIDLFNWSAVPNCELHCDIAETFSY